MKTYIILAGVLAQTSALTRWGQHPLPSQFGLSELMGRLADSSTTTTTQLGLVDQINAIISQTAEKVGRSQSLAAAQLNELNVTTGIINQSISLVESNEHKRIALIKEHNKNVLQLNQVLTEMTTGAQQMNDVISLGNRVKKNLAQDLRRLNEAIGVTNDWMVQMDSWATFVRAEKTKIDAAQGALVSWGDGTKNNLNLHEVAAVKLAREAYDLESDISGMTNLLLSTGKILGYTASTLTIPEASGGLGWQYTYWS